MKLSGTGVWAGQLRYGEPGPIAEAAAELDELGYSALWIPDVGGDVLEAMETLLGATERATVATGILNVWMHEAAEVRGGAASWSESWQQRALFGLGVSHAPLIDRDEPGRYTKPYQKMVEYLDGLDAAEPPLPVDAGPRRARPAHARARARPHGGGAPVSRAARALGARARDRRSRRARSRPSRPSCSRPIRRRRARSRATTSRCTCRCRTTTTTCAGWASATPTSRARGAIASSTRIVAWGDVDAIKARVDAHRRAGRRPRVHPGAAGRLRVPAPNGASSPRLVEG